MKEPVMPAPKKPQDRLAKAEARDESVAVEFNGQTYELDNELFNDVEILEMIGDMEENPLLLPKLVRTILGPEQWAAFKDANRNEKGRVPGERLNELFEAMDAAVGNSAASSGS
jgi:sulfur carrier protein ThiS